MTFEIILLLAAIAVSLVLFSLERLPADVIALGLLLFITITGLLPAEQAFSGFGSDAVLMILGLLILTAALNRTGFVELVGGYMLKHTGQDATRILVIVMIGAAVVSTFVSNTAATALFIPIVIIIARKAKMSTSQYLMPLAFATILSSSVTLIATSTNIVVSGVMTQYGLAPISMFEMAPVGLPILALGMVYMLSMGRALLPKNIPDQVDFEEVGELPFIAEVVILPGSSFARKTLSESGLGKEMDLTVLSVRREQNTYLAPQADLCLEEGDILLVRGHRDGILSVKDMPGIDLRGRVEFSKAELQSENVRIVEAILLLRSRLVGRTLTGTHMREKYGLQVLAINHHGETIVRRLNKIKMQLGDVLLLQGDQRDIAALEADKSIRVLGEIRETRPDLRRAPIALAAFVIPIFLATLNLMPLAVAVLVGVLVVFVSRCITPEEAYREVEWKMLILIGCMLGVGSALEHTGAANYLARHLVEWVGPAHPTWLLAVFFVLSMLLTQPMSNQAAAVVIAPIALQTALQLGVNPRTFGIMIAVGASCSFLTPLEPACLMVYGPGRYRFMHFFKVGALLSLLILVVATLLVPLFWPL